VTESVSGSRQRLATTDCDHAEALTNRGSMAAAALRMRTNVEGLLHA
jgi:hypothetical protein